MHWPDVAELALPTGCGRLVRESAIDQGIPDRLWREGKIQARWRTPGVRCRPLGREGHRSFKKLCQDFAIPPWQRPYLPLVYADEEWLALADYCLCEGVETRPKDTLSRLVYQAFT
jgi:tRNA(Ile)-lysidine synthase